MKAVLVAVMGLAVATLAAQEVTKPEVAGVRNFARLETTVACAGATGPEAMPEIKKMGFVSVINLRVATERAPMRRASRRQGGRAALLPRAVRRQAGPAGRRRSSSTRSRPRAPNRPSSTAPAATARRRCG